MPGPVYANGSGFKSNSSMFELIFVFEHRGPNGEKGETEMAAHLAVSPSHMLQIRDAIIMHVEKHEQKHGPISENRIVRPQMKVRPN